MNKKTLILILFLALPQACLAQESGQQSAAGIGTVTGEFTGALTERRIENFSILLPAYLTEKKVNGKAVFRDDADGIKIISVSIDNSPLEDDLKEAVSSKYEFWEKTYYPGESLIFGLWSKMYKSGFVSIEKMERVNLADFDGFLAKGVRSFPKSDAVYTLDYVLFRKGDSQRQISLAIQSTKDYFLSDAECGYILSTLKAIDETK